MSHVNSTEPPSTPEPQRLSIAEPRPLLAAIRALQAQRDALQYEVLSLKREIRSLREGLPLAKRRERSAMAETLSGLRDRRAELDARAEALSDEITNLMRGA